MAETVTGNARRRFTVAGLRLGIGLGGFVDGIVLHQVLQWHHLLTDHGRYADAASVRSPAVNTLADGLFHASALLVTVAGRFALWRAVRAGYRPGTS